MGKYGVTINGFRRKTYNEILADLQARAREVFGDNINLSNTSFLGMWLQNEAWEIAELWELAEDVYYSPFVDTSEGLSLDGVGKYITIARKPAQKSRGVVVIEADKGTRFPKTYRVSDENVSKVFETTKDVTVDETEVVEIPIISIHSGLDMNVEPYFITKAVNPIPGIKKIYNREPTIDGTNTETDREFRERYYRSISRGGSSTREAVEAALLDMDNVVDAFVVENDTMEYKGDIPPKSLYSLVEGGDDIDIAKTILKSKAGGIRAYGDTEIEVEDSKGVNHIIGFSRPIKKDIYIKLSIARDKGYPGDNVVKRAVLNYIGGEDEDGIFYKGLKLGEDVVISKIMSSVMCLSGIKDIQVEISLDNENWQSTNIEIAKKEIANTKFDKVVINHVE